MKTVIEMARDAGCGHESIDLRWVMPKNLERFAALVREDEREKLKQQLSKPDYMVDAPVVHPFKSKVVASSIA